MTNSPPVAIGDVVRHHAGGPLMIVWRFVAGERLLCVWTKGCTLHSGSYERDTVDLLISASQET